MTGKEALKLPLVQVEWVDSTGLNYRHPWKLIDELIDQKLSTILSVGRLIVVKKDRVILLAGLDALDSKKDSPYGSDAVVIPRGCVVNIRRLKLGKKLKLK